MNERLDNNHPIPAPVGTQEETARTTASLKDRVRSLRIPDQPRRTGPAFTWLPWIFCLVLAGISGYLGYRTYVAPPPQPEQPPAQSSSVAEQTAPGEPSGRTSLVAGGYIIPVRRVVVSPKVGGEVIELLQVNGREIREGDFVEKGQWLARLDRTKYEFEYRRLAALADQAKAEMEKLEHGNRDEEKVQAAAALEEAQHQYAQLRDESDRLTRSRTATTAEELFRVDSRLRQTKAKVDQLQQLKKIMDDGWRIEDKEKARSAYQHAVAQRDNAKYDLDNTEVVAPVSGVILIKRAEVGNTVRPEAFSNGLSASLCEMADLTKLEVDVDVSERDLGSVYEGQPCEIRTEAPSDTIYTGRVGRLMPEANRSKASVSVRVQIDVPSGDHHLRPEMRARVAFLSKEKEKTVRQ